MFDIKIYQLKTSVQKSNHALIAKLHSDLEGFMDNLAAVIGWMKGICRSFAHLTNLIYHLPVLIALGLVS